MGMGEPIIRQARVAEALRRVYSESVREGAYPVSYACGRLLYALARALAMRSKERFRAVEVGSGLGFSTMWLAAAVADSGAGGEVLAIEIDAERARRAEENLVSIGLSRYARVIIGDALEVLPDLPGPFHLAFLDGRKDQYGAYLRLLEPKMPPGSLLLAHNVIWPAPYEMADFLAEITRSEKWLTIILPVDPAGVSLSIKLR